MGEAAWDWWKNSLLHTACPSECGRTARTRTCELAEARVFFWPEFFNPAVQIMDDGNFKISLSLSLSLPFPVYLIILLSLSFCFWCNHKGNLFSSSLNAALFCLLNEDFHFSRVQTSHAWISFPSRKSSCGWKTNCISHTMWRLSYNCSTVVAMTFLFKLGMTFKWARRIKCTHAAAIS